MRRNVTWHALVVGGVVAFGIAHSQAARAAHSSWHIIDVRAPGPYVDAVGSASLWLSSGSLEGFIAVGPSGRTKVFKTPGFMPRYLTLGEDGRIWATDVHHSRSVGAITTHGQLTVYQERIGSEQIPTSRIRALGNYGYTYVGASGAVLQGWGGEFYPFPYPSGLTGNHDIASALNGNTDVYFTECCLLTGGAITDFQVLQGVVEDPLPYAECAAPAGMTYDGSNATIYVACAGASDALLVSVTPSATTSVVFPGSYVTRVDTIALGVDGNLYFATGSGPSLVRFSPSSGMFSTVPTPDGSIPRAIELGAGGDLVVIGDRSGRVYRFAP
jgi:sugar lactone lactonase YvrE